MWNNIIYDRCLSFINCHSHPAGTAVEPTVRPTITISRQTGAGGRTVAGQLAEYLQNQVPVHCTWTVFDKNLMTKVMEDHHLSQRIAQYEPEGHMPYFRDWLEELFDLHPSTWNVVQYTADTILRLACMGNVIIVGRGAAVVTARMDSAFHVRLVGSLERRLARVREVYGLDASAAAEFVKTEDKGRARYLKDHYQREIEDPLLYDLVINTDRNGYDDAARLVGDAVIRRFKLKHPVVTPTV